MVSGVHRLDILVGVVSQKCHVLFFFLQLIRGRQGLWVRGWIDAEGIDAGI